MNNKKMMKPGIAVFDTTDDLSNHLGGIITLLCKQKNTLNIAISGGSTPSAIFDFLSLHFHDTIEWEKIRFFWVDERCVSPDHPASNYGMTLKHLLLKVPVNRNNVFRVKGEDEPVKAALEYSGLLKTRLPIKNHLPYLDLTLLGMGHDGHTASIFPGEIHLWNSLNLAEVGTCPLTGQKRVTLTGGIINNSGQVIFLVTGKEKAVPASEIINQTGAYDSYPASLVSRLNSVWLMDTRAASGLKRQV